MKTIKNIVYLVILLAAAITLSSCASAPKASAYYSQEIASLQYMPIGRESFHTVLPHETLWRIGKMNGVSVEELMRANNLKSPQELVVGQRLRIPGTPITGAAQKIPLYQSNKWEYIIIHHSATGVGSASFFNRAHLRRGFWKGLGYHFVIDNGTLSRSDGQIEACPRWLKQEEGAHCKASGMNHNGIGICLVGNFSKNDVSERQLKALVNLVNTLKKYYNIPDSHIIAHGRVPGAKTECPGRRFPWARFREELAAQN